MSRVDVALKPMAAPMETFFPGVEEMRNFVLSAVLALGLMAAGVGLGSAQAQYGHHGHGHCGSNYGAGYGSYYRPGLPVYSGGYGYGGYSAGYGSYRNVPPVVLGQIYTQPVYRTMPYSSNFGGFYGSGLNGMNYSNFGTGLGYGYGPSISIGIGSYGGHRF